MKVTMPIPLEADRTTQHICVPRASSPYRVSADLPIKTKCCIPLSALKPANRVSLPPALGARTAYVTQFEAIMRLLLQKGSRRSVELLFLPPRLPRNPFLFIPSHTRHESSTLT